MSSLTNKHILLGVTGGIAAYKSAELLRILQKNGAKVRVVMTEAAQEFITPLTMQALSGFPVATDLLDTEAEAAMGHIELARWADCILIAPATANCIAGLVSGAGGDLLSTLCLASRSPIAIAPAMNQAMWSNAATQSNMKVLAERGVQVFGPAAGQQACGDVGLGRMLEPTEIADQLAGLFQSTKLSGRRVVITAGPTREALDPVRYLSNHSSGKMGYALARAAAEAGAQTVLISGPTSLAAPERVDYVPVVSAMDMYEAVLSRLEKTDIFIGAAAVADYRPKQYAPEKIKKTKESSMVIELEKNPDIIASVAKHENRPFTVGFAAETTNVEHYAQKKLSAKNLDMIVANDVSKPGTGFNSNDNAVTVFWDKGEQNFDQRSKTQLARDLLGLIADFHSKTLGG